MVNVEGLGLSGPKMGREGIEKKKADPKEFLAKMLEAASKKKTEPSHAHKHTHGVSHARAKETQGSYQHQMTNSIEAFFNPTTDKESNKLTEYYEETYGNQKLNRNSENKSKPSQFREYLRKNALNLEEKNERGVRKAGLPENLHAHKPPERSTNGTSVAKAKETINKNIAQNLQEENE